MPARKTRSTKPSHTSSTSAQNKSVDTYFTHKKRGRNGTEKKHDTSKKQSDKASFPLKQSNETTNVHEESIPQTLTRSTSPEETQITQGHKLGRSTLPKSKQRTPIQTEYHMNVGYLREGEATDLTENELAVVKFIKDTHIVPIDFDVNKNEYGCLSGLCFERRLISAYEDRLIKLKKGKQYEAMCMICGNKGHFPRECPAIFDSNCFSQRAPIAVAK